MKWLLHTLSADVPDSVTAPLVLGLSPTVDDADTGNAYFFAADAIPNAPRNRAERRRAKRRSR